MTESGRGEDIRLSQIVTNRKFLGPNLIKVKIEMGSSEIA